MSDLNGLRIADKKHIGLAEMLKGGVIMDVTNHEQAKIAEDAGAAAVMALERVPSDIRKDGGGQRTLRLSFSSVPAGRIDEGVRRLAETIKSARSRFRGRERDERAAVPVV